MKQLTLAEAKSLIAAGRCIYAYPRKQQVSVDGHKRYKVDKDVMALLRREDH